jgi:hypothetical protein
MSEREYGTLRDRCVHSPRCMTLDEHDARIASPVPTAPALDVLQDEVRHLIRATDERDWTQRDAHMRHLRELVTASPTTDTPK